MKFSFRNFKNQYSEMSEDIVTCELTAFSRKYFKCSSSNSEKEWNFKKFLNCENNSLISKTRSRMMEMFSQKLKMKMKFKRKVKTLRKTTTNGSSSNEKRKTERKIEFWPFSAIDGCRWNTSASTKPLLRNTNESWENIRKRLSTSCCTDWLKPGWWMPFSNSIFMQFFSFSSFVSTLPMTSLFKVHFGVFYLSSLRC